MLGSTSLVFIDLCSIYYYSFLYISRIIILDMHVGYRISQTKQACQMDDILLCASNMLQICVGILLFRSIGVCSVDNYVTVDLR